jgi:hypothetical protein
MPSYLETLEIAKANKRYRYYPVAADPRCIDGRLFPHVKPSFRIDFNAKPTVFTIGSCFARNIEEALVDLGCGVQVPTLSFSVPKSEWAERKNGLLNEYNAGAISQRILWALEDREAPERTIVDGAHGEGFADLLLPGNIGVPYARAVERRREIFEVYKWLKTADLVIITLGLIEAWYDQETECFLNQMPSHRVAMADPNRYVFKRLDVLDAYPLLEKALRGLETLGIKVLITLSPVPIGTTFGPIDCVTANEFSKSVLRVCAERLAQIKGVDYFPSYEIVRSGGLSSYVEDNIHVKNEVVHTITKYMVDVYRQPAEATAQAAE